MRRPLVPLRRALCPLPGTLLSLFLLLFPAGAAAQALPAGGAADAAARPTTPQSPDRLFLVERFTVAPVDARAFLRAVLELVRAAREAELPAEHGWRIWTNGTEFLNLIPSDTPDIGGRLTSWVAAFEGTPGEARVAAAMATLASLELGTERSIGERVGAWSYLPEAEAEARYRVVLRMDVRPGAEQELDVAMRDLAVAMRETGYPYGLEVFRPARDPGPAPGAGRPRGAGAVHAAFLVDDLTGFYDDISGAGIFRQRAFAALGRRIFAALDRYEYDVYNAEPLLSYAP